MAIESIKAEIPKALAVFTPSSMPMTATDRSPEQKRMRVLVERRHPDYKKKKEHWRFLASTYEGGRDWFDDNIFQYVKEGPSEYAKRKERAYRFNHTREVVDLLNKYLFRQAIARNEEDAPESVKKFWKRCTRNGLGMNDFSRQISRMSSIFGRIAIVVDNNMPAKGPVSVAEAKKNGYGVYAYIVGPEQLLDYSYDDRGDLNWVLIEETYRDDTDPFDDEEEVKYRWRLWTKEGWKLFAEKKSSKNGKLRVEEVGSGTHNLKRVPVILHDNIISDEEWSSPALIDDIAYLDRAVANYLSNLDAIIQDQTFSQLAMPAQGLMPGDKDYQQVLDMGTKRVFVYDGEGGARPEFISPDVKQANLIIQAIQKIINEIYHTVGLAGERTKEDNSVGIDNSSGVAKAYDFERVNSLLAAKAAALELTENRINELVALWNDEEIKEPVVHYPDDFDTRGLYDEFDIAARLILVEAPDTVRREQMASVVSKLFPMASEAEKSEFAADLDKWPLDPIEQAAKMAEATAVPVPGSGGKSDAPKARKDNRQGQVTKNTK